MSILRSQLTAGGGGKESLAGGWVRSYREIFTVRNHSNCSRLVPHPTCPTRDPPWPDKPTRPQKLERGLDDRITLISGQTVCTHGLAGCRQRKIAQVKELKNHCYHGHQNSAPMPERAEKAREVPTMYMHTDCTVGHDATVSPTLIQLHRSTLHVLNSLLLDYLLQSRKRRGPEACQGDTSRERHDLKLSSKCQEWRALNVRRADVDTTHTATERCNGRVFFLVVGDFG